jgi:16S rRNA (adenine1518-N6/adenine1519-N6)-dimethyltransferase
VGPGSRVLEVGAGLGSLTLALAETGAMVVAVELDRRLIPPLEEVAGHLDRVQLEVTDAVSADWGALLDHPGPWTLVANLPYNVAVPVVMGILEREPRVIRLLVMVQKEVGERLTADPGHQQYGAVSVRVAYRAQGSVVRRISRSVFWPQPKVDSVLVSLVRREAPVKVDEAALWEVVDVAFGQRRKAMRGALIRLGMDSNQAEDALARCGVEAQTRPERLGLPEFACLSRRWTKIRPDAPAR